MSEINIPNSFEKPKDTVKRDCAMYKAQGRAGICRGLNDLECLTHECKFYKPSSELDYEKLLDELGYGGRK